MERTKQISIENKRNEHSHFDIFRAFDSGFRQDSIMSRNLRTRRQIRALNESCLLSLSSLLVLFDVAFLFATLTVQQFMCVLFRCARRLS